MELDNFSKHCGSISHPWSFISSTNKLNVTFRSNSGGTGTGFLAVWTATTEPPTSTLSCDLCNFPFTFGGATIDTCIKIVGVDTLPWCSATPPTTEGTHIPYKIPCADSDSSCPSTPHQTLIASLNYPLPYPNNVDQVK